MNPPIDTNTITHIWTRFNPHWIAAGVVSGLLAGLIMLGIGSFISAQMLGEWSQSLKLLGAAFYGLESTAYGPLGKAACAGALFHFGLSTLYGATFTQLVHEKAKFPSLLILGIVTSFIVWVFGWMLLLPSLNFLLASVTATRVGLLLHFVFGFSFPIILYYLRPLFLK